MACIGERRLAVVPSTGGIHIYILDVDELVDLIGESLSRVFTEVECQEYFDGFECPTVEQLRGGSR